METTLMLSEQYYFKSRGCKDNQMAFLFFLRVATTNHPEHECLGNKLISSKGET